MAEMAKGQNGKGPKWQKIAEMLRAWIGVNSSNAESLDWRKGLDWPK